MKKLVIAALTAFVLLGTGTAVFAKTAKTSKSTATSSDKGELEVDGSFAFATGPSNYDSGFGLNFGAGIMLGAIDRNLQARVDISYYDFSTDFYYVDLSYTRVPVTVSARYYFPINEHVKPFVQAGLETSFDSYEYYAGGVKRSKNEVNFGISPGGGIEFSVSPQVGLFALGRIHAISDNYFSMQFGAAYHF